LIPIKQRLLNWHSKKKGRTFALVNNVIKIVRKNNRETGQSKSFVRRIFVSLIESSMFQKYNGYSVPRKRNTQARTRAHTCDRNKWEYSTHSILFPSILLLVPVFVLFSRRAFPLVLPLWVTTPVRLCNAHVGYILWQMYKDLLLAISSGKSRATRASQTFRQSQFVAVYIFASWVRKMRFWACNITMVSLIFKFEIFSLAKISRINYFSTFDDNAWQRDILVKD